MTIEDRDNAHLITHALATDTLSRLRDAETEQVAFRKGLVKLGRICGYEIIDGAMETEYVPVETPLEETMGALATAVRQGKALYVGISSYSAKKTAEAAEILDSMGVKLLIHQPSYSMLNRWVEEALLDELEHRGVGSIAFSPLAQGLLTEKYLGGVPADSRAGAETPSFKKENYLSKENLERVRALNRIAERRGQSLAQMALAWVLKEPRITTVLIGASRPAQIEENVAALDKLEFSDDELAEIDRHAKEGGINLWAASSEAG